MKKAKILVCIILILFAIAFSIVLPLGIAKHYVFNEGYYKKELTKLGVYSEFSDADGMVKKTISYLKGENIALDFLDEKEAEHMEDVRNLINRFNSLFNFSAILFLILLLLLFLILPQKAFLEYSLKSLLSGSLAVVLVFAALFLLSPNFNSFFALFHTPFFESSSWIFPSESTLVNLFPVEFFYSITYRIAAVILAIAVAVIVFSFICLSKLKQRPNTIFINQLL